MTSKIGVFAFLFTMLYSTILAQTDLKKIIPLSPNAASISKYGEIPVSHFTGVPNISIPVYHVKSKDLEFPLQLSYHAGGNKVEETPSWVGMGWSLSGAPMISRSVRGIPDESIGGFFSNLTTLVLRSPPGNVVTFDPPVSIKTIQDSGYFSDPWLMEGYFTSVYKSETDPEADIFFYNLSGKSGKFFWDQVTQRFHTYPWSNIKITFSDNNFEIIDEDGTVYVFPQFLRDQSGSATTAWWASKMYNANKTDSISYFYDHENQTNYSLDPHIKTIWGTCENTFTGSITSTGAYTLDSVVFNDGYVLLKKDTEVREDLDGGYSLKTIEVYNKFSKRVKKLDLAYTYRSGIAPSNYDASVGKRLVLTEVREIGADGSTGEKHSFLYDSTIDVPHRLSLAQDYWGYYNGATTNTELTPDALYIAPTGLLHIPGANRNANPQYSQFGILKRITYPTGGYSEFEYENNMAFNPDLPPAIVSNWVGLAYEEPDWPPPTNTFIDSFEINVPPNQYLNNNQGGATLNASIGGLGCDLSGGSSTCATLTVRGLDVSNSSIFYTFTSNISFTLPNGNYEIKAVFNQDPPEFQNFYFVLTWKSLDTAELNQPVGGLRIKSIKSFDGVGNHLYKQYKYNIKFDTDTSSGEIFGTPYFIGYDDLTQLNDNYCIRIFAQSTQLMVSHSGSYIGYRTVYELSDSLGNGGLTEYNFTHQKDLVDNQSPFPPAYTMEAFRGQSLKTTLFKKEGTGYFPISRTFYEYTGKVFDSLSTYCIKARLTKPGEIQGFTVVHPPEYHWRYYDFAPAWSAVSKKTERVYDQADTTKYIETVTNYEYSPSHYQLAKSSFINSRNQLLETSLYYPPDLTLSGTAEDARQLLVERNLISPTLKQEKKVAGSTAEILEMSYKNFYASNIVELQSIKLQIRNAAPENRVEFLSYDTNGNVLVQKKTNDISQAYIWDYQNNYPVAECRNADSNSIAYTSFEAEGSGNWTLGSVMRDSGSITGEQCYQLTGGDITRSSLNASTEYILTYWTKNSSAFNIGGTQGNAIEGRSVGGWKCYMHRISGVTEVTISGSGLIDELRLYPKGAQMTTYTYEPLIGITSQCDMANKIIYYEYDSFGRLKLIRDQDKNILKTLDYQYQVNTNQ